MTATSSLKWMLRLVLASGLALGALVGARPALAAEPTFVHWALESIAAPTKLQPGGENAIFVTITNLGDAEANGASNASTVIDTLPAGIEATAVTTEVQNAGTNTKRGEEEKAAFVCSIKTPVTVECTDKGKEAPEQQLTARIKVNVTAAPGPLENHVTLNDAEAKPTTTTLERPLTVGASGEATPFGVETYEFATENDAFEPDTSAGDHPFQLTTTFNLNDNYLREGGTAEFQPGAPALAKQLSFRLPAGLIGNVNAVKQCTDLNFGVPDEGFTDDCPNDAAVGVADIVFNDPAGAGEKLTRYRVPIFNLTPAPGEPARLGFSFVHVPVVLDTSVRTGEDYGVTVQLRDISEAVQVLDSKVTIWGEPYDSRHDTVRGWSCLAKGTAQTEHAQPCEDTAEHPFVAPEPQLPYLTMPTECEPLSSPVSGEAWNPQDVVGSHSFENIENETEGHELPSVQGCAALPFGPGFEVKPETHDASTPTGLTVNVKVPTAGLLELPYESQAEAAINDTKLTLPAGMQASAGASNGLTTCDAEQAGFNGADTATGETLSTDLTLQSFTPAAASCPESAKIGTVTVKSPVLEQPLTGSVYFASQDTNPFASPLVLYLIAEEPKSKVTVKLAGEVQITSSGQLISDFRHTPQAPFEELTLHLNEGPQASQATPARCGEAPAAATFATDFTDGSVDKEVTPPASNLEITSGPGGSPCPGATLPFAPIQLAESTNPQAGAFSPFRLTIERPDGDAALKSFTTQLPPGAAAVIASVTPCPEPQAAEGTCGPESEIGQSVSSSGLGSHPFNLPGKVYLTGPYDGAPFGLSAVTPVENVGPFSLGTIVVRSAITVNEFTAAATITTNASEFYPKAGKPASSSGAVGFAGLPEIIEGVPAQVKRLVVTISRPGFDFNPTSCAASAVTGQLAGYEGVAPVNVSTPFQVANCGSLPFGPKLTATVTGHGSKADGTSFDVTVESPGLGQANIHKVDLTLPAVLPSRLTTIQKACLEAVFNKNPASCEEGSVIGEGIVHTPVFKNPLRGPAYLVSHGNASFPDVEFVLQGENVTLILDGKTDIKNGITYSKFETSPDAPFTKFESNFPAGPHSALTPNVPESEDFNLCNHASSLVMPTEMTGQNNAFKSQTTQIKLIGCGAVASFITGKTTIRRHSVKGSTLTLVVFVPGPGRLAISGSGLHGLTKSFSKGGTYTLKVKLGPKGKAAVTHKHLLKMKVHVKFTPSHGTVSSASASVKFH